ncbi:MAG: DUF1572 family protein [Candidatus Eisenbacteria bacterium]
MSSRDLGPHVLEESRTQFAKLRALAEAALAQVDDAAFFALPEPSGETNSIALVVKHMAGNARSRWSDFLTSDGEKSGRDRDREFELGAADTREALMTAWTRGWELLDQALEPLGPDDLMRTATIRGEPHTVLQLIDRQLTHYGYHVGQIVLLARLAKGGAWSSLSVPRGQSAAFNQKMIDQFRTRPPRDP